MKLTHSIQTIGAPLLAGALVMSLTSCGTFFAKETTSSAEIGSEIVAASEQEVAEVESSTLAANNLAEMEQPEKKRGLFGKFFGKKKKGLDATAETTGDFAATKTDVDAASAGFNTIGQTPSPATRSAAASMENWGASAVRSTENALTATSNQTKEIAKTASDTGVNAVRETADTGAAAVQKTADTAEASTASPREPSRPNVILPDEEPDMFDNVPSLTKDSGTKPPAAPVLEDDGFLPLTPSPKYPSDEGILVPGE